MLLANGVDETFGLMHTAKLLPLFRSFINRINMNVNFMHEYLPNSSEDLFSMNELFATYTF